MRVGSELEHRKACCVTCFLSMGEARSVLNLENLDSMMVQYVQLLEMDECRGRSMRY